MAKRNYGEIFLSQDELGLDSGLKSTMEIPDASSLETFELPKPLDITLNMNSKGSEPPSKRQKKQLSKSEIKEVLLSSLRIKFDTNFIVDIDEGKSKIIGRPKIPKSQKQLCHVIPFLLNTEIINSIVNFCTNHYDAVKHLSNFLTFLTPNLEGISFYENDLLQPEYSDIKKFLLEKHDRLLKITEQKIFFYSPSKYLKLEISSPINRKAKLDFKQNIKRKIKENY